MYTVMTMINKPTDVPQCLMHPSPLPTHTWRLLPSTRSNSTVVKTAHTPCAHIPSEEALGIPRAGEICLRSAAHAQGCSRALASRQIAAEEEKGKSQGVCSSRTLEAQQDVSVPPHSIASPCMHDFHMTTHEGSEPPHHYETPKTRWGVVRRWRARSSAPSPKFAVMFCHRKEVRPIRGERRKAPPMKPASRHAFSCLTWPCIL